jgi:hypothetical protein
VADELRQAPLPANHRLEVVAALAEVMQEGAQ